MSTDAAETGATLRKRLLDERRKHWRGRGKYVEPSPPRSHELPPLPPTWVWASPEEVAAAEAHSLAIGPFGSNLKVNDYADSGVPLVFVRNIRAGRFGGPGTVFVPPAKAEELAAHQVSARDILITKMGDPPGDACLYPASAPDAIITADCIKLRLAPQLETPQFFVYALNSPVVRSQVLDITKGVAQLKVSLGRFSTIGLPLPPRSEQRRIVDEIDKQFTRLDAGVAALQRVQANLKRYRAAILKAACEGRLVPTEAELARKEGRTFETGADLLATILKERGERRESRGQYQKPSDPSQAGLPTLPEGWVWCMSDALFVFVTSGSRGWAKHYSDDGPIFLRIGNLEHENIRLDLSDTQHVSPPIGAEGERTSVQARDILISITADVGMIGLVPSGLGEAYINQHVALARPVTLVSAAYLAHYLSASEGGWGRLKKRQRGATKVGLGLDDVRAIPVPLPPLAEQARVVAEVERRLSVVEELEAAVTANLQRATRLRQSVLRAAFSAKRAPVLTGGTPPVRLDAR